MATPPATVAVKATLRTIRVCAAHVSAWHTLRHSYATHLAMAGVPIVTIKELLGHSEITMTQRYAHYCPSDARDVVSRLPRLVEVVRTRDERS